jgi:nicotinate phosphoribosyltransferase
MAYGYWKLGLHERPAVFHQIFRKNPFQGNYAVAAGLETVIDFLKDYHFSEQDISYLSTLRTANGGSLFPPDFLLYLKKLRFTCDVDAVPEGTVIFPHEPLLRIKGPLIQGQLLESTLLNIVNFQTLVATKASRVREVAGNEQILEFGMRRAQGPDGALSASRAAYIGGCDATSNVLAGKLFDIPVCGTHAHSWVTVFPDEQSAFLSYAQVMPQNCTLLVDTYDTIQGVKNAIETGKKLREAGAELQAIRLDSGDLASLSVLARELLDKAGFQGTQIIASNSLDEYSIADMRHKGSAVSIWGVGTNLVTAYDHPALDGVYKLSALQNENGEWEYKIKISEQAVKVSNPGIYQVRRYLNHGSPVADMMFDEVHGANESSTMVTIPSPHTQIPIAEHDEVKNLLVPIFRKGKCEFEKESIQTMRERSIREVRAFRKIHGDKEYQVGLESHLHQLKQALIAKVNSA